MGQSHVEAEGTTPAPVDAVWALVSDANTYATWGPWNGGGYDPPADGPSRAGFVQWFRFGRRTTSVERILEVDAPSRIVYTVVRGLPVKDYRAEVTLTPNVTGGTSIRWEATWENTLMGRLVQRKLRTVYRQVVEALVVEAGAHHAVGGGQPGIEARHERQ
jgi:uncharacterized protein YndB with AHSA1/START domain